MKLYLLFIIILFSFSAISCTTNNNSAYNWPVEKTENKPGVYWWWMGSAVDKENLTYNLETLSDAGIGGALVIPIYGVRGEEDRYIDFLSPEWIDMLSYTSKEANRLHINIDMTTGTGWPFGGSHIKENNAAKKISFKKYSVNSNNTFNLNINPDTILSIRAFSPGKNSVNLFSFIEKNYHLSWNAPAGNWEIYLLWMQGTKQKVKRAAPGNEGLVLDPFSADAMSFYLQRFEKAFKNFDAPPFRAQYHDSYEYYHANWSDSLFSSFKKLNGYDLQKYLPFLFSNALNDSAQRIKADFRKTLSEMHFQYIEKWVSWAHRHNWITRNEAHGAPANILDTYALSDIPETEVFGSTYYDIPGLRQTAQKNSEPNPIPLITKFSSSAAHVCGKKLIASETCTWLRDHYMVSLSQIKPEIDELFLSGINHIYYHGNAYSPKDAAWPGWIFYASTHFEPENTIWKDLPALNKYITRCQSILQSGKPANDILLYWPVQDIWQSYPDILIKILNVHTIDWFTDFPIAKLAFSLKQSGFDYDYISDKQIEKLSVKNNNLHSGKITYKTIIIPQCSYIPIETMQRLYDLSSKGATVIFQKALPLSISGFTQFKEKQKEYKTLINSIPFTKEDSSLTASIGKGKFIISHNINSSLKQVSIKNEYFSKFGVQYIKRKRLDDGYDYFIANLNNKKIEQWIPLSVNFESILFFDPLNGKRGTAKTRTAKSKEFFLQLEPGQSLIIRTFNQKITALDNWPYKSSAEKEINIKGPWKISFLAGGPIIPQPLTSDTLILWSQINKEQYKYFSGTAKYSTFFNIDNLEKEKLYILDLGTVYESARVMVNKKNAGIFWSIPFIKNIGSLLKNGKNSLEIEVTNLAANRITYLDKMKIDWKKFFFVNIDYKKYDVSKRNFMDSGVKGPIKIYKYSIR
jgi:hypothetical protein